MKVTSKGQVTIPRKIRERLGLQPSTEVEFAVERGAAVLRPKLSSSAQAQRLVSHLKVHGAKMRVSSKTLLAMLRSEPDEFDAR